MSSQGAWEDDFPCSKLGYVIVPFRVVFLEGMDQ